MEYFKRLYSFVEGLWWFKQLRNRKNISFGSVLEKQAAKNRDKTLIFYDGGEISYSFFNETANRYSHLFQKRGFIKGDVVAVLMDNRPEFLMVHAGLAKIGVIPALINSRFRGEDLAGMINIPEARALVLGAEYLADYLKIKNSVKLKKPGSVFVESTGTGVKLPAGMEELKGLIFSEPVSNPSTIPAINSKDILEYIYTSGTSGSPRCVEIKHQGWLKLGFGYGGIALRTTGNDIQYLALPLCHNSGINIAWSATVVHGAALALAGKFSAEHFWGGVKRYGASSFVYNGEMIRALLNLAKNDNDSVSKPRCMLGSGLNVEMWIEFQKRFGIRRVMEVYSITEDVGAVANLKGIPGLMGRLTIGGEKTGEVVKYDPDNNMIARDSAGRAVRCRNGETGLFVALIKNGNPFTGYKNDKNASRAKIVEDLFKKGDKYFITGDLFKVHRKGYVSFTGRLSDSFRVNGKIIIPEMVTDVLYRSGLVEYCDVYGVPVNSSGEMAVMAAVTLREEDKFDTNGFAVFAAENLPAYAIPFFVRIQKKSDVLSGNKPVKSYLVNEGFSPLQTKDPLYFLDRAKCRYIKISRKTFNSLSSGTLKN